MYETHESLAVRVGVSWQERRRSLEGLPTIVRNLLAVVLAPRVLLAAIRLAVRAVVGCMWKFIQEIQEERAICMKHMNLWR
jgi:hypothetical protein